ncbi:MAG: isochorismatase family cysteine hydrolase [Eubacteriales bacterium]
MKKALILIDYVYDFVADNGALTAGAAAQSICDNIADTVKKFKENGDFIVVVTDNHDMNDSYHREFKLFPHHCHTEEGRALYGRVGDEVAQVPDQQVLFVEKTRYSAFCGTPLMLKLIEREVTEVALAGVCTDICILHTAMDCYNQGLPFVVDSECVASFDPSGHFFALEHIEKVLGGTVLFPS